MKISNLILAFTLYIFNDITAQTIVFADINLKNALLAANATTVQIAGTGNISGLWGTAAPEQYVTIDTNNDGEIQQSEATGITFLFLIGSSISNFSGIEHFINLKYLEAGNNTIISLNITSLNHLETLNVSYCQLTSLNLTGLTSLKNLGCSVNQITALNFAGLPNLENVVCINNLLTSLDFTGNPQLVKLLCSYNPNLTTVKIKNGATQLFPDSTYCIFDGNPNLTYICADAAEIPILQAFQATCAENNASCVIDSACALGTEGFEKENVAVFPNPATNSFIINTTVEKVAVYNLTGQLVQEFKGGFESGYNYDIQGLSAGVYLVKIVDNNNNEKSLRLIKRNFNR